MSRENKEHVEISAPCIEFTWHTSYNTNIKYIQDDYNSYIYVIQFFGIKWICSAV